MSDIRKKYENKVLLLKQFGEFKRWRWT